jgi:hypothetical protein
LTAVGTGAYLGSADTQKDIAARIDHDRRFAIVIMTLIQPSLQCLRFDLRSAPPPFGLIKGMRIVMIFGLIFTSNFVNG